MMIFEEFKRTYNFISFIKKLNKNIFKINYMKKLISFDLDWTLAESKSAIDSEMAELLIELLQKYDVAIISGWDYPQYAKQVIPYLTREDLLNKLHLYPTCWTKAYIYGNWEFKKLYSEDLEEIDVKKAIESIEIAIKEFKLTPEKTYWELIENRETQITYSALWQEAPYEVKKSWDPDFSKRKKIIELISPWLPKLSVSMWGSTSIDITKSWIDKAYAIKKLTEHLKINEEDIIFIWDALMEWWNDFAVRKTKAECIETNWPEQTKEIIKTLINNN